MKLRRTARRPESFPRSSLQALNLRDWLRFVDHHGHIRWMHKRDGRELVPALARPGRWSLRHLQALRTPIDPHAAGRQACAALGIDWQAQRLRGLEPVVEPRQLVSPGRDHYGRRLWLHPQACAAWLNMANTARREGTRLVAISGFRAVAWQQRLLELKLRRGDSLARILAINAPPGFSEHHSGCALDITGPDDPALETRFEHSPAFDWLLRRAASFGFHLSFPRDNRFGYQYEPWHWCFKPVAMRMHNAGISGIMQALASVDRE